MVIMKKRILLFVLLLSVLFAKAWAAESFVVRKISIEGLQRVSSETVYSYLPIKSGETLRPEKTGAIISDLYKTGFFYGTSFLLLALRIVKPITSSFS